MIETCPRTARSHVLVHGFSSLRGDRGAISNSNDMDHLPNYRALLTDPWWVPPQEKRWMVPNGGSRAVASDGLEVLDLKRPDLFPMQLQWIM